MAKIDTKLFGGILLIVGTAIGGGMLALPIATAKAGFLNSLLLLILCWFIMTASALLVLEINLWLPANTNIISMTRAVLGRGGETLAWINYLLLFYSVVAAYIAGGSDFLHATVQHELGWLCPNECCIILFTGILGAVVYRGIHSVDYVNRHLMISKLAIYLLLVIIITPFISIDRLIEGDIRFFATGTSIMATSFTFANIIPSLRTYFSDDAVRLRKAILIGSLIPLVCYIAWDMSIMGVTPRYGKQGLLSLSQAQHVNSEFVNQLGTVLHNRFIILLARIFTAICLATSFLASALSLSDFLADGLSIAKKGKGNIIIYTATFLPPFLIVLFYPGAFIRALSYAGLFCIILFVLLPALMAWQGRYVRGLSTNGYQVQGGKPLLGLLLLAAILAIFYGLYQIVA